VTPMPDPQITDKESLERWLEGRPREDAVVIAYRAAMRVAPLAWLHGKSDENRAGELVAVFLLRVLLTMSVAHVHRENKVRVALDDAADSSLAANGAALDDPRIGVQAIQAAANSVRANGDALYSAEAVYLAALDVAAVNAYEPPHIYAESNSDCEKLISTPYDFVKAPLWSTNPRWFSQTWDAIRAAWTNRGPGAAFWITWYEKALRGEHDWPLLHDVALIPDADWQKGEAHVGGIIEGLVARHALDDATARNPYAHRVLFDGSLGKLVSVAVEVPDLASIIEALRGVIRDFEQRCKDDTSHNKLGEDLKRISGPALKDLKRDAKRFAERPLDLFDAIGAAQREIGRSALSEGLGKDALIGRLIDALGTRAEDICVASPAVLETQRKRMDVRYALLTEDRRVAVLSICAGMRADSTGFLEAAAGVALQIAGDPGRSEEEKRQAWYFMQAMLPRGARAMIAAKEDAVEGAAGKKKGKLDTVVAVADAAVKLDKGVDAVREMAGEALGAVEGMGDWPARIVSEVMSGNWFRPGP
jgi:hypothetical protein